MKSIGEMWARGVNEKTQSNKPLEPLAQTTPVKPVVDKGTEARKAQFRQGILSRHRNG